MGVRAGAGRSQRAGKNRWPRFVWFLARPPLTPTLSPMRGEGAHLA
ncbi:hypothetical protein CBM2589_B200268 [Cupriavidus taiwanensis]|uniref:Uncharacterized protein n=1 Tax=Cupriavidus taiwanensis TaxID=164546 RepID=A0A975WY34_9BURK|nr:hypothetical protein CBM2589_B200268 [Cupriavidus taiwanensis]